MQVTSCSKYFVDADKIADAIPFVSTPINLINIFLKFVVMPMLDAKTIQNSHYFKHLQNKSYEKCFLLLFPVIGNILVLCLTNEFDDFKDKLDVVERRAVVLQTKLEASLDRIREKYKTH